MGFPVNATILSSQCQTFTQAAQPSITPDGMDASLRRNVCRKSSSPHPPLQHYSIFFKVLEGTAAVGLHMQKTLASAIYLWTTTRTSTTAAAPPPPPAASTASNTMTTSCSIIAKAIETYPCTCVFGVSFSVSLCCGEITHPGSQGSELNYWPEF